MTSTNHSRVRVVHVVLQLQTGGMEKLLVEFARHADRARFDLRFLALGPGGRLADDIAACGWPVTALDVAPGLRPGLAFRLAWMFRGWRPDVVHTHNTKPLLYAGPAARLARVPVLVHTRHGQRFGAERRQTVLFRLVSRLADRVVCVSHDSARLSVQEGLAPNKVCAIWNGIDVNLFGYTGPADAGPAVMVGRLSPEKDVDNLLRATALVVRQEPDFRLEIAGDGPCMPALRRTATELGLDQNVRFLGEVRDVPALLARASFFVLPSLTEGISLTLLEAMARGLPIVATRVGGNPEVMADGETGLLVPSADPAALAEGMRRLRHDPDLRRRMGRAGRQRVETLFDVRRMVAEYEACYRQLLDPAGRRSRSGHDQPAAPPPVQIH
jgi:sugar transferase (PEP-CTERM/EpsH1 system associated)